MMRLPIGERPRSAASPPTLAELPIGVSSVIRPSGPAITVTSESPIQNGQAQALAPDGIPSPAQDTFVPRLVPTSTRNVFNRQRVGSIPSPIDIDRVSKDLDAFSITVAGGTAGFGSSVPLPSSSGPQTFPETPSEFSPMWSATSVTSPMRAELAELTNAAPDLSRAMSFNGGTVGAASLTQQVLLARAATSVRGARPAGNANRPRITAPSHPYPKSFPLLTPPPEESPEDYSPLPDKTRKDSPLHVLVAGIGLPSRMEDKSVTVPNGPPSPLSRDIVPSRNSTTPSSYSDVPSPDTAPPVPSNTLHKHDSSHSLEKPSPPKRAVTPDGPVSVAQSSRSSGHSNLGDGPGLAPDSGLTLVEGDMPTVLSPQALSKLISSPTPPSSSSLSPPSSLQSQGQNQNLVPTPSSSQTTGRSDKLHLSQSFTLSLGAPPPYYSIIPDNAGDVMVPATDLGLASTSSSPSYMESRGPPGDANQSPGPDNALSSSDSLSRQNRMARMRPRLPAGPRNPIPQMDRNDSGLPIGAAGSGSSVHNGRPAGPSSFVPKFQTAPMKWRGYTMDAAKWIFTSGQLQAIVSRAIRQSAEAYSIRLLRLETLDTDIPEEMHRLEMLGTDVKTKYKELSRKRYSLLSSLAAHVEGPTKGDAASSLKLVDELADVSYTLDRLAEELHSVDEQVANLRSLRDIHSASALAMALRKLNASFLRQSAETQALRAQIDMLEAERDDAWKHAEDVAHEFDDLTEKVLATNDLHLPANVKTPNSRRSSRVLAVRKSSVRALKAGLRPSRSSSVSSFYRSSISPNSGRPVASPEVIPPVPPIPRQRPLGIETSNLTRSSMGKYACTNYYITHLADLEFYKGCRLTRRRRKLEPW
jgi:hypothetical protein